MATGRQDWRTLHPVAEIHWKHRALKYGFSESLRRHWGSSCTRETSVSFIPGNRVVCLTDSQGARQLVPYTSATFLRLYLRQRYRPTGPGFVCRTDSVGVIRLQLQDHKARPTAFVLVCVDTARLEVLGTFRVRGEGGRTSFEHVDVYSVATNADRSHLALSLGMVHDCDFLQGTFESAVVIYDTSTMEEVYRVTVGLGIAAVAFDPRSSHNHLAIAGIPDRYGTPALVTFDLTLGKMVACCSIQHLLDPEGETQLELSYSKEGCFLALQTLEPVGYSREWLYNTYLFTMDTLEPIYRCCPSLLQTCHTGCMPIAAPQVSPCGSHMALGSYCSNQKAESPVQVYRLPCSLSLMKQCRAVIIRTLQGAQEVDKLPLPTQLKTFLWWDQRTPTARSDKAPCRCPSSTDDVDNKGASWYTKIDDVTCNPEASEIPLHPRARNETYS